MKSSRKSWKFLLYLSLSLGVIFLLSACQVTSQFLENNQEPSVVPSDIPTQEITKVVLPTVINTVTITPTATEILPTPTYTAIPCLETSGTIQEILFPSAILAEDIKANVYLPPCYEAQRAEGYPLLVLLHGQNGLHDQWINLGLTTLADEWITNKVISPLVIVMPFERLYLMNSYTSQYDSALVEDLLPQLLTQYNLKQEWGYRAIGGLSRGGNWAVRIAFEHPEAFGRVGAHSYTTFSGDINRVQEWLQSVSAYRPALWFDIGESDQYRKYGEPFVLTLQENGVDLIYQVNLGSHTIDYWMEHIQEYLAWYTKEWN